MRSIKTHLTLRLITGFSLLSVAGIGLLYYGLRYTLLREFDERLAVEARSVITFARMENGRLQLDFCDRYLRAFAANQDERETHFFEVWNPDGSVLARSASTKGAHLDPRFGTLQKPAIWNLILPNGRPGRAIGFRYDESRVHRSLPTANPELRVVVAANREEIDEILSRLLIALLLLAAFSCVTSTAWVSLSLRKGMTPIERLATHTNEITTRTLSSRFPVDGLPIELKPIGLRLNELMQRIEAGFERERRFNADIAHELRTPLAELRTLAEIKLRQGQTRETIPFQDVLASALQMEKIVNCLLALSRCDSHTQTVEKTSVNLAALCRSVLEANQSTAEANGVTVETKLPNDAFILADPALSRSILQNIIENAFEYSPQGSTVRFVCERREDGIELKIINRTRHLTSADTERMFDRFWRKDATRTPDGRHCGLGLSLVRALCELQQFRVKASLTEGILTLALFFEAASAQRIESPAVPV
ncbi:MAG TPA: ATP-binding protein [Verrucomicrobiae bacterium]|nr:ATP-binding protein [Verrucomicrobiae bacterium]